jgi:acyl carrier protein
MDDAGNMLATDEIGEIVIQGDNVTTGYENNPEANQVAFTNGWFRTGDQGYLDAEGYLFLTGRIKEIINRGGEKIAPREIDEALMTHPAVVQAVTFAVPHPTIGEDITAAVILGENKTASEMDLREYAFSRLADFKVPSRIIIVDEIPKGPTGKLQRIGLGEKFAPLLKSEYVEPQSASEEALANIWKDVLNIDRVGIYDNFFHLGGDSLIAVRAVSRISAAFSMQIPLETMFRRPTIFEQAKVIEEMLFDELGELSEDEARRLID